MILFIFLKDLWLLGEDVPIGAVVAPGSPGRGDDGRHSSQPIFP